MRPDLSHIEKYRIKEGMFKTKAFDRFGAFEISADVRTLRVIVAPDDKLWEHISVSLPNRCPNWPEMCMIKELFWDDEDTVIQFHPKKSEYVNNHRYCLHLWKYNEEIPTPPSILVGIKKKGGV